MIAISNFYKNHDYKQATNKIYIGVGTKLRDMATNEGATYDFPLVVGNTNISQINDLFYRDSEGKA